MKNTFKTILLLLILISTVSACRKNPPADIRDSLVGNYNCEVHKRFYYDAYGAYFNTDTLIGYATIRVSKSLTSDGLIVDGNQYDQIYYQDSAGIAYVSETDLNTYGTLIHFHFRDNSILMDTNSVMGNIFFQRGDWTEFRGAKVH